MREVLISIQPKWVEKICHKIGEKNGNPIYEKRVEVRKTKPKCEVPFKAYIYETQGRTETPFVDEEGHYIFKGRGQVIGEFVCDRIIDIPYSQYFVDYYHTMPQDDLDATCLDMGHIDEYLLSKDGYGWHITDLVVYDKPRELPDFLLYNVRTYIDEESGLPVPTHEIARPFQSWGYVKSKEPLQTADTE